MNYELATELKDAGFPQDTQMFWCSDVGEKTYSRNCEPYSKATCGKHTAFPNLSELIEVCGQKLHSLIRTDNGFDACEWQEPFHESFPLRVRGTTPEQAIARFWLALNKR